MKVKKGRGALFMEMRLGKTLTAINYLLQAQVVRNLIIAPYAVIDSWGEDFEKMGFSPGTYSLLKGTRSQRLKELNKGKDWVVSNYESAERLELHKISWYSIILDESIKIANPKAKVTKYFLSSYRDVPRKMVLCGNPAPENLLQYVTQYIFFQGNFMGFKNYWSFRNSKYEQIGFDWVPKPDVDVSISRYVHKTSFLLTRKDAGIGSHKFYQKRIVKMNAEQKKQYKAMRKDFEYGERQEKNTLGQCISLSRIAGGCSCEEPHDLISKEKLNELIYLLRHDLKGQKVLVWCRFKQEAQILYDELINNSLGVVKITGKTKIEDRKFLRQTFKTKYFMNVAILTIASSAKGQDWSAADTAIYWSNEYSNDLRSQSEDRLCHTKKTTPILVIDLISEKSIDEKVLKILKEKQFNNRLFMSRLIAEMGLK